MSKYWKYLDLTGWQEQSKFLLEWTNKNSDIDLPHVRWHYKEVKHLPEMQNHFVWWQSWGLSPHEMFVLRVSPSIMHVDYTAFGCPHIHTDQKVEHPDPDLNGVTPTFSINIPLSNCDQSITRFYEVDDLNAARVFYNDPWGGEWGYDPNQCREVDRYSLTKPTILDIKIPHSVHNPTTNNRIAMCYRFAEDAHLANWFD